MIKSWRQLDCDIKMPILVIVAIILMIITFITTYGVTMLGLKHDNVKPDFVVIKTYENNVEIITNNYNETLDGAKNSNKPIDISRFLDETSRGTTWNESSEISDNLNKMLVAYVNNLAARLKKVNAAIKNNMKIDYNSLKISYNSSKDNNLAAIIKSYVDNYRVQHSLQVAACVLLLLSPVIMALVLALINLD